MDYNVMPENIQKLLESNESLRELLKEDRGGLGYLISGRTRMTNFVLKDDEGRHMGTIDDVGNVKMSVSAFEAYLRRGFPASIVLEVVDEEVFYTKVLAVAAAMQHELRKTGKRELLRFCRDALTATVDCPYPSCHGKITAIARVKCRRGHKYEPFKFSPSEWFSGLTRRLEEELPFEEASRLGQNFGAILVPCPTCKLAGTQVFEVQCRECGIRHTYEDLSDPHFVRSQNRLWGAFYRSWESKRSVTPRRDVRMADARRRRVEIAAAHRAEL